MLGLPILTKLNLDADELGQVALAWFGWYIITTSNANMFGIIIS